MTDEAKRSDEYLSDNMRSLDEDFYICPNTGERVYKWSDERFVLITTAEAHELRQHQDGRS